MSFHPTTAFRPRALFFWFVFLDESQMRRSSTQSLLIRIRSPVRVWGDVAHRGKDGDEGMNRKEVSKRCARAFLRISVGAAAAVDACTTELVLACICPLSTARR